MAFFIFRIIISSNVYVVLNRNFHSNVNVLGRFHKHVLTSLYKTRSKNICKFNTFVYACPIIRDYYMTFSISALVLARDSHIKPDSEAGVLIWVEGWYQGLYGKFHVIIFLSHILTWPHSFPLLKKHNWRILVFYHEPEARDKIY
jgi:hypothetical protein